MPQTTVLEQVRAARRVNVPIISIATPDPAATIATISKFYDAANAAQPTSIVQWDCIRGCVGLNSGGLKAVKEFLKSTVDGETGNDDPAVLLQLTDVLHRAARVGRNEKTTGRLPERSILFVMNAHRHIVPELPTVVQACWNVRDPFKVNYRTLILLAPYFMPPVELADDILPIEEPLPTAEELETIVVSNYDIAKAGQKSMPALTKSGVDKAVDALRGLAAFPSEQVVAMSLQKDGMNVDSLWERKRKMVESTPGLSIWRGNERFSDIGGLSNLKHFLGRLLSGNGRIKCVTFIDEIEKSLAGASGPVGDSTGVSQAMLGTMLSYMQDKQACGMILIGPAGVGKSMIAKAAGNEAGIPTVYFDLSGMKASLVGESEANLRRALRVVSAISDDSTLFIATSNSIASLPPELRRRYQMGTIFVDLPDAAERTAAWAMYVAKFALDDKQKFPFDEGWSGAEIRACCEISWRLDIPIVEAGTYIVPVAVSAKEQVQKLRKTASNRFISASYPGLYKYKEIKSVDEIETVPFETGTREFEVN